MDKTQRTASTLRQARLNLKLSQLKVATQSDINLGQYQRLEYGQRDLSRTSMRIGLAICSVLHLDPFALVLQED